MKGQDMDDNVTLESGKYFSECLMWELQKKFYCESGIDAWQDVPSEPTSNPYIANCCAHIIVAFIKDMISIDPSARKHPFYIMEPGAGIGKFAFYTIKRILELLALSNLSDVKVCYIMCDIVEKNIGFYRSHPQLKKYIESGNIDFANYALESDQPILLRESNHELTTEMLKNPLIMLANYVFDTASHEAFNVKDRVIRRLLVDISSQPDNLENGSVKSLEKLRISLHPSAEVDYRYADNAINEILDQYREKLVSGSSFLIPNGTLQAVARLKKLANNRLLMIATDKGHTTLDLLQNLPPSYFVFHASFSLMVNFHAISEYFKKTGGDAHLESVIGNNLATCVFTSGYKISELPEMKMSIDENIDVLSPSKYYRLYTHVRENMQHCSFDALASFVILSHFDPRLFSHLSDRLMELYPTAIVPQLRCIEAMMPKLIANYYYVPFNDQVLFNIAFYLRFAGKYELAVACFKQTLDLHPDVDLTYYIHYNLGYCYKSMKLYPEAIASFENALKIKPEADVCADEINEIACRSYEK